MSRWGTVLLVLLAVAAGVFVFGIEPRLTSSREREAGRDFVMNLDAGAITGLRIVTGDDVVELTRKPDGWTVGPRPRDRAATVLVLGLLQELTTLEVLDRVAADDIDAGRAELDDYGLDSPKSEIEVIGGAGGRLLFGKEAVGDGRIYVRRGDSEEVFVVRDALQKLAFRRAKDFRDPVLTALTVSQIDRFVLKTAAGEVEVARSLSGWEIVRPLRARAGGEAVEKFLEPILRARIEEFVADESDDLSAFGLSEPRAEVIFYANGEKRPLALRFGGEAADGKSVIVQSTARDSVYRLPIAVWDQLGVQPDDLRDRRLVDVNLDTIDRIRIGSDGESKELVRAGDGWRLGDEAFEESDVVQRVAKLTGARVIEYRPVTREELAAGGFGAPVGVVEFDAWLSENTPESARGRFPVRRVTVGKVEGDRAWVRVDDEPEIAVIDAAALGWFF